MSYSSDDAEKGVYWRPTDDVPAIRPDDADAQELPREETAPIERAEMTIDPVQRQVRITGRVVQTTNIEFAILKLLASRPYWAYAPRQITAAVRETGLSLDENAVDGQIASLRDKLGVFSDYVQTVPGIGYRFKE
jgi:DNA-binding response OmpR family regulator